MDSGMRGLRVRSRLQVSFTWWGRYLVERPWAVIGVSLLVALGFSSALPTLRLDFANEHYLLKTDSARQTYDRFVDRYGLPGRIVIALKPPSVFERAFLERLRSLHADLESELPHLREVVSLVNVHFTTEVDGELVTQGLMDGWTGSEADVRRVRERARSSPLYLNTILSEDLGYTAIVVEPDPYSSLGDREVGAYAFQEGFTEGGAPLAYLTPEEAWELIAVIEAVLARHELPGTTVHLVGGEVMAKRLADMAAENLGLFLPLSTLAIGALLWLMFWRITAALLPLLVVLLSVAATFGCMGLLGIPFTLPTQILPSFLLAAGVCDGVHILAIVYQRLREGHTRSAAVALAIEHSGVAVLMTSLTTAGGLLSFRLADISPVADLGVVAPIGVFFAFLLSLTLLPALVVVLPLTAPKLRGAGQGGAIRRILVWLGAVSTRRPWPVVGGASLLVGLAVWSLPGLRYGHDPLSWFLEDDPMRLAMLEMDERFRGLSTIEVLLDTGADGGLYEPELLQRLDEASRFAESRREGVVAVGKATSIVDIVKEVHQTLNEGRVDHYAIPDTREAVAQELLLFEMSGTDALSELADSKRRHARLTLKISTVDGSHYGPFMDELREKLSGIFGPSVAIELTGGGVLASRAIGLLLESMARSYLAALLVITVLMVLLIGNLRIGLLSMIPNLTPIVLVLALMAVLEIPLNVVTMLMGSIVIGVVVDDTIHCMLRFSVHYEESGDVQGAVEQTLLSTGAALLVTSAALAASFFLLMLGELRTLQHFGFLTGAAVILALLADLMLAPALLTLVLGREPRGALADLVELADQGR